MYLLTVDDPFDECKRTAFSYPDDQFDDLISDAQEFCDEKFLITIRHIDDLVTVH